MKNIFFNLCSFLGAVRSFALIGIKVSLLFLVFSLNLLQAQTVSTPVISAVSGEYPTKVDATITCATAGSTLYYTLNGIDPTPSDTTVVSGATVTVWRPQVLKVKAFKAGELESAVASAISISPAKWRWAIITSQP